jgi:hypothetical protein
MSLNQATEPFDLSATVHAVLQAFGIVICNIGFQVGVHGFILACLIGVAGLYCLKAGKRAGKPFLAVFRKVGIFCFFLSVPGAVSLAVSHQLPAVGHLRLNSFGLFGFWSLILAHLIMEEMNFQWFPTDK